MPSIKALVTLNAISSKDGYSCFIGCGIEQLVIGNSVMAKADQPESNSQNYRDDFIPD